MDVDVEHHPLVIVGGGIGGLILALYLDAVYNRAPPPPRPAAKSRSNDDDDDDDDVDGVIERGNDVAVAVVPPLKIHVYESASSYNSNAGGAIGLYPNGLRVLRDLSKHHPLLSSLLADVRRAGCDYVYRRWMRHDGDEVCVAREDELLMSRSHSHSSLEVCDAAMTTTRDGGGGRRVRHPPRGGILGAFLAAVDGAMGRNGSRRDDDDDDDEDDVSNLRSMGIRRYRYQDILHDACREVGIVMHFGKRLVRTSTMANGTNEGRTMLEFKDGTRASCSLLIGADGINSKVREQVINPSTSGVVDGTAVDDDDAAPAAARYVPAYTGVTCLMGCANVPFIRGICFPSSVTTRCHACYYIARRAGGGDDDEDDADDDDENRRKERHGGEVIFQIYFPSPIERPDQWRTLTPEEARDECRSLADRLRHDGWDEMFLAPLESETLSGVLRVGIRNREALDSWHVGGGGGAGEDGDDDVVGPAVLLGDAAHPPVPYIGQGAMMATEDAGTLAMVLREYCPPLVASGGTKDDVVELDLAKFSEAMRIYESLRVDRVRGVLASSVALGKTQQRRAESKLYNAWREASILAQVWAHGTLPVMRLGASYDYRTRAEEALAMARSTS